MNAASYLTLLPADLRGHATTAKDGAPVAFARRGFAFGAGPFGAIYSTTNHPRMRDRAPGIGRLQHARIFLLEWTFFTRAPRGAPTPSCIRRMPYARLHLHSDGRMRLGLSKAVIVVLR